MKNIYFVSGKTYHCQRTLNWLHFRWCHFMIKCVWFQHSKFSQVAKMIYNSISDACSVFVPICLYNHSNLTKNPCKYDIITSHIPLSSLWFPVHFCSHPNGEWKVQNDVLPILIYEFNIYYFLKREGGSYWRGVLVNRNMIILYLSHT